MINCTDTTTRLNSLKFTYDKYRHRLILSKRVLHLNEDRRPHDGRTQFVTSAKKYKVDEYAIGHAITDITEKVYTKRETKWLQEEIEKIK